MSSRKATSRKRNIAACIQSFLSDDDPSSQEDSNDSNAQLIHHLVACHEQLVARVATEATDATNGSGGVQAIRVKNVAEAMRNLGLEETLQAASEQQPATKKQRQGKKHKKFTAADAAEQERLMEESMAKMIQKKQAQPSASLPSDSK